MPHFSSSQFRTSDMEGIYSADFMVRRALDKNPFMPSSAACMFSLVLIIAAVVAVIVGGIVYTVGLILGRRLLKGGGASELSCLVAVLITPIVCLATYWIYGSSIEMGAPSPHRQPSVQDIVGIWQFNEHGLQFLQERGYTTDTDEPPTLELRADDTFIMTNLPYLIHYLGNRGGFASGSGTWRIRKDIDGTWDVILSFTALDDAKVDSTIGSASLNILGKDPPYQLYRYVGDPDEGRIITLERR